jgi:hypothetical protein
MAGEACIMNTGETMPHLRLLGIRLGERIHFVSSPRDFEGLVTLKSGTEALAFARLVTQSIIETRPNTKRSLFLFGGSV